ncbi:MAG: hypothetical protein AAGJ18_02495 [Bacteroidota bacterium]
MKIRITTFLLCITWLVNGQTLVETSFDTLFLEDSLMVVVATPANCKQCYYYLPTNLRPSLNQEKVPEISLTTWYNEDSTKIDGGILHYLMVWGLTFEQEATLQQQIIERIDSVGVQMGAVTVIPKETNLLVEGTDEMAKLLRKVSKQPTPIATTPGAKMAMSFYFGMEDIGQFLEIMNGEDEVEANLTLSFLVNTTNESKSIGTEEVHQLKLPMKNLINYIQPK